MNDSIEAFKQLDLGGTLNENRAPIFTASGERRWNAPGCLSGIAARPFTFAGKSCFDARPFGCEQRGKTIMALHGDKLLARIGALVQAGTLDPAGLPRIVALRAGNDLDDYTPWPHAAFRSSAPDFGGGAERFLREVVEPLACDNLECSTLLGYSLSGLFALFALQKSNAFDTVLIASPSSWYPDFVEGFEVELVNPGTRIALACGEDEGRNHPSPIDSTRARTDLLVGRLDEALRVPCALMLDEHDHHHGLDLRLERLLTWYAAQ